MATNPALSYRTPDLKPRPWRRPRGAGTNTGLAPGQPTAGAGNLWEIIPVFGASQIIVRIKTGSAGGTLDAIFVGPDFDPDQQKRDVAFASLTGTQYATGNPTQLAVSAGTEALMTIPTAGEGFVLPKFTGGGTGTITYVDVCNNPKSVAASSGGSGTTTVSGTVAVSSVAAIAAGETHIGEVGTPMTVQSGNFTRPADTTAYASGDLVANSTTAGSVAAIQHTTAARVATGKTSIRRVRLKKSTTTLTNASFRCHAYGADPAAASGITNGDNGAWLTKFASYLGSFDVVMDKAMSDAACGQGVPATGSEITVQLASGQIVYWLVEARAAYTPGNAEVVTLEAEYFQA